MDNVIVFFGRATAEQVEQYAVSVGFKAGTITRNDEHFFLWRYSAVEQATELDGEEIAQLQRLLGSMPASAFAVTSRHGANARFALEIISQLMLEFNPSVLDDDFGHFWSVDDVQKCLESDPSNTIYALREWANKTMEPTR
jgi:hypothetical protein